MFRKLVFALLVLLFAAACGGAGAPEHTPQDVIDAFQAAGLEAESPTEMGPDDYGAAPLVGDGMRFLIPSLGEGNGGRIIAVSDENEREQLVEFYESLGESSAAFFSWVFTKDNIVVQINGSLDEEVARQYEEALNNLE